jgi:predicted nicotinamide N-methyase
LAAWIADRPTLVRGRHVVDLGCGAGLTALIAARAGARVTAVDLDAGALAAVSAAARRNGLDLQVTSTVPDDADLVLAADLLYAPEHAALLAPWTARGVNVLAADCRAGEATAQAAGLTPVGAAESAVWPDLDRSAQFRTVHIWQASLDHGDGI